MKKTVIILILILGFSIKSFCQTNLVVMQGINLPKDSTISNKLISGFSNFLNMIEIDNSNNPYISTQDKVQTLDLIDEINGIQKSEKNKNNHFYKPYLTNVVQKNDSTFFIQLSFIGTADSISIPRANFEFIGKVSHSKEFSFSSPISSNTEYWKVKKIGKINFHFKNELNIPIATDFSKYVSLFDTKLGSNNKLMEYYCCNDATEALQILGITYKFDYNGRNDISLSHSYENTSVIVTNDGGDNFNSFDPHDLWHDRLHNVISVSLINKPIDEGCAYLYGGSWGLSWKEIYKMFTERVSKNRQTNWLDMYLYNFGDSQEKHLIVGYVINALIVQKLEKEKGFDAVVEFLKCGKYEKSNENYFATLNKLIGINKANFNTEVWKLIDQENK
jgi:hypothetical protein